MMPNPTLRLLISRFTRAGSGTAAVEFALIAPAFFALLYAIMQVALIFFAQQALQTATTQASRLILTNQAQTESLTAAQFQQAVCTAATSLFNCSNLYVNVQTFSSFSSMTMFNPVNNGTFSPNGMSYSPGTVGSVELVQVFYLWPVWPGPLGFNMANTSGNTRVLVGVAAFRNEPS
jgi:Flp pilus assembly protein TadG